MVSKLWALLPLSQAPMALAKPVTIKVDGTQSLGPWTVVNRFFGADEPNFAYYPHGQALLKEIGALSTEQQAYFRTHNLLTTGSGSTVGVPGLKWGSTNAYTLDASGNPVYNFTIVDQIVDAYIAGNVKPYFELGFMPLALATDPLPYFFNFSATDPYSDIYQGWSHPPTSYDKWEELIYELAAHLVEKYGEQELSTWYFEVWNEPNIPYWNGTTEQYYELWDRSVAALRKAYPAARIGGPAVAGGAAVIEGTSSSYLGNFIDHTINGSNSATNGSGSLADFLSFHAKGLPLFLNTTSGDAGYIQMNVSTQLQQVDQAFEVIASYAEYKDKPIVLSECDPDGCAACESAAYNYRNDLLYPAYTAASFSRILDLALARGVNLAGLLTWAFEYEVTELLPDETGYFDGFRVLSTQGIDKPVFNMHRMWGLMTGNRVSATSSGQISMDEVLAAGIVGNDTDVGVLASVDASSGTAYVFVWHYNDNDLSYPDAQVTLDVAGLPVPGSILPLSEVTVTHYRIDEQHSNAYTRWLAMGSPQTPSQAQIDELVQAGKLQTLGAPRTELAIEGALNLEFTLPIRALSLVVIENKAGIL